MSQMEGLFDSFCSGPSVRIIIISVVGGQMGSAGDNERIGELTHCAKRPSCVIVTMILSLKDIDITSVGILLMVAVAWRVCAGYGRLADASEGFMM